MLFEIFTERKEALRKKNILLVYYRKKAIKEESFSLNYLWLIL